MVSFARVEARAEPMKELTFKQVATKRRTDNEK